MTLNVPYSKIVEGVQNMNCQYQISIIMPALNEGINLSKAIDDVKNAFNILGLKGEIIVVNDGSTDDTEAVVMRKMAECNCISMIRHDCPMGIGSSYWDGVKKANGELVTWIPGDGESNCFDALRYFELSEHVDIIVPFVFNPDVRSWKRNLISKLYKGIINLSFGTLLNYMNGATIYRRCVLDDIELETEGFFFQVELLIKCIKRGYLYAEVPCALNKRLSGKSRAISIKSLLSVIGAYFKMLGRVYIYRAPITPLHPFSRTAQRRTAIAQGQVLPSLNSNIA